MTRSQDLTDPATGTPDALHIGLRIRSARRRQKMTQADVAARAGIDKGYLSRLERGEKIASVGTLHMLATALGSNLSTLLGEADPKDEIRVTRSAQLDANKTSGPPALHQKTILAGGGSGQLSMMVVQVGTQGEQETAVHGGDEAIFVLEGTVKVEFGNHTVVLASNDSVTFPGYLPHSLCAQGKAPARALVVIAGESR